MVARLRWAGAHNYVEWKKDELSKDTFLYWAALTAN